MAYLLAALERWKKGINHHMTMSPDEVEEAAARWKAAWERGKHKPLKILPPLPVKVRTRLWLHHQVDAVCIWLADHHHLAAAERLWRICRMW